MARPLVLDTSALILASRYKAHRLSIDRIVRSRRAHLPAVVIAELYAGTSSSEEAAQLSRFFAFFIRNQLMLSPELEDWELAGQLLGRRSRIVGQLRPRDHMNDLLIAICAARVTGSVVTANVRHLEVWAQMLRGAGRDVQITPFPGISPVA